VLVRSAQVVSGEISDAVGYHLEEISGRKDAEFLLFFIRSQPRGT
jgi:hypothetical protein